MKLSAILKTLLASLSLIAAHTAMAQAFPSKPINMVVAFPAGGASDFVARVVTKEMAINLHQPITPRTHPDSAGHCGC